MLPNLVRLDVLEDRRPVVLHINAALLGLDRIDGWPWHVEVVLGRRGPVDDAAREALQDAAVDLVDALLEAPDVLLVARFAEPDRVRLLLRAHFEDEVGEALAALVDAADPDVTIASTVEHDPTWARALPVLQRLAPP